ncbi:MAG: DUF2326 domain-containing protein [Acidimicrobiaceae bacterium]|nr:DUF2326 domain-containing protein [Acidimicrobiia bacterium]MCY4492580.1 DUF2326 domain-containing protein [Acidimicrobiaceae bacterium]
MLADRDPAASDKDTRNGSGKTSLVHLIHFLLGGNAGTNSIFRSGVLVSWKFGMELDVAGSTVTVSRTGDDHGKVKVAGLDGYADDVTMKPADWSGLLGERWYGLAPEDSLPSTRSLLSYAVRNVESGGLQSPFKQNYQQTPGDWQTAATYLLDLDWRLARKWQEIRDLEAGVKALRKVLQASGKQTSLGSVAELRTEVALIDQHVAQMRQRAEDYRVLDSFRDLEDEANELTRQITVSRDGVSMDRLLLQELETTYEREQPPDGGAVAAVYEALGLELGDVVRRRFDEVERFHSSVVKNRQIHLAREVAEVEQRISIAEASQASLDRRRQQILTMLQTGGALDELTSLQEELARETSRAQVIRERFQVADRIEADKGKAREEKQHLLTALQQDHREREAQLRALITDFEAIITALYKERRGSLVIDSKASGPDYRVILEDGRSLGIGHMGVFAFDLLTTTVLARNERGPGFLVHDSHMFDGVDSRQIANALALGHRSATEEGFQYIVTLNSDAKPDEFPDGFAIEHHILNVSLTDESDSGRLFGVRF